MLGQAVCIKCWSRYVGVIKSRSSVTGVQSRGYYHTTYYQTTFSVLQMSAAHYNTYKDSDISKHNPLYLILDLDHRAKRNCAIHPILFLEELLINFEKPSETFRFIFNMHCTQMLTGLLLTHNFFFTRVWSEYYVRNFKGTNFYP